MSEEIKFRVWAKKRKGYRELDQLVFNNQGLEEIWAFPKDDEMQQVYHPSEMVVEQYTGLTDKNGKEIYEGDIIKVVNVHDGDEECWEQPYGPAIPQEVKWDEERLRWSFGGCRRILYAPEDFEVIGNIHENPELVGGEE